MRIYSVHLGVQCSAPKRLSAFSWESSVTLENTGSAGLQSWPLSSYIQTTDAFCALSGRRYS